MQLHEVIIEGTWLGTAEDCEIVRQFCGDFAWQTGDADLLDDPVYSADEVTSEIENAIEHELGLGTVDQDARELLRLELEASAERFNERAV